MIARGRFAAALACAALAAFAWTAPGLADGTPDLLARMEPLEGEAPGADAAEVLHQARRALAEAARRRGVGDEAGARRAESIAEAAVLVAERRIGAARARRGLVALRERGEAARERLRIAGEARDRAREERARLTRERVDAVAEPEAQDTGDDEGGEGE